MAQYAVIAVEETSHMLDRKKVVDEAKGYIRNVVEWDGESVYVAPEGYELVPFDAAKHKKGKVAK